MAGQRLQVLILTCHPERYLGLDGAHFFDLDEISERPLMKGSSGMEISGEAVERWPEAGRGTAAAAERISGGTVA